MKHLLYFIVFSLVLASCDQATKPTNVLDDKDIPSIDFKNNYYDLDESEELFKGSSYLSVYSEIYMYSESKTYALTSTISLKNIYLKDSVFITNASYYNTHGQLIRNYIDKPIVIKPMETVEIVIGQKDSKGGSGGNFHFDWAVKKEHLEPHFEAVMISTTGQQGLSFTSQGIRID